MRVTLDDGALELAASVRHVLSTQCPSALVRAAMDDPQAWRPLWKTVTELGWLGLAHEDADLGLFELVATLEACGEAAAPIPVASSLGLAAGALHASEKAFPDVLEELAAGAVGTLLLLSADGRGPGAPLAYRDGRLTGRAVQVPDAARADLLVVLAADPDGSTVIAVVRPGAGVEVAPAAEPVDPSQPLADVTVDVVAEAVPVSLPAALSRPLVTTAAELVGLSTRILGTTVDYAKSREQFGRPIGAFQGVKHRLADCYVAVERARSLTYVAAAAILDHSPTDEVWLAALLAKAAAVDASVACAAAGVQIHGAIGMTWEHDMHLFLRRAWQSAVLTGDSASLYRAAGQAYLAAAS